MADAALAFTHAGAAADEAFVDDLLVDLYGEAIERLGHDDVARRAQLLGHLAVGLAWRRGLRLARPPADQALGLARRVPDTATRLRILTTVRRALTESLDLVAVERVEDELFALAGQLDDPGGRARAAIWRFETRVEQGRGEELDGLLAVAARNVASLRQGSYHHSLAYTRSALALLRGDVNGADRLAEEAADVGRRFGLAEPIVLAVRLTQLLAVRIEQSRLAELRDEIVGFFAAAGVPEGRGIVAFVRAANGETDGVREDLAAAFETYDAHGPNLMSPPAFIAQLALPLEAVGDAARASRLYTDLAPHAGLGGYFAHFSGPMDWALGVLARTMGREEAARGHFLAGAEFARRLGAPLWVARCEREAMETTNSGHAPRPSFAAGQ